MHETIFRDAIGDLDAGPAQPFPAQVLDVIERNTHWPSALASVPSVRRFSDRDVGQLLLDCGASLVKTMRTTALSLSIDCRP